MFSLLFALALTPAVKAAPACALAAPRIGIATIVKFREEFYDGTSVVLTDYLHYDPDTGRFLDSTGRSYAGPDPFVGRLADALHRIESGGPAGLALIGQLEAAGRTLQIAYGNHNDADMDHGEYIHWNPECTDSAPDQAGGCQRPAYVGLAHELAHILDVWMGTINRRTWRTVATAQGDWMHVPYAELYATHIENKIRAENGLPLRASYAGAITGSEGERASADGGSMLVRPGTRESLYFAADGSTSYHRLKHGERAMSY